LKSCLETDLEFYSKSYEAEWPGKSWSLNHCLSSIMFWEFID
jgi:hypothetical protein